MNYLPLEPRFLRYFVTLAEELHYRRAAERLDISTPALSVQIKRLETLLSRRLCERSTAHGVHLTRYGRIFLREARRLLGHMQNTMLTMQAA